MLSFSMGDPAALRRPSGAGAKRKVLVTGANGNIGSYFAQHAHEKYELVLMVRSEAERPALERYGQVIIEELNDLDGLTQACAGVDTVLHLAASASPSSTWSVVLQSNIIGTYHLLVAAKAAGCRRVIYASSIHAVSGYPRDVQVKTTDPPNPGDLYGVSKVFGEALSRYMAEQEELSVIALRIGGFQPPEKAQGETGIAMLDAWVSQRDLQQLIEKCIEDERLKFAIFNGLSDNPFKRLDLTDARELVGYAPQDSTGNEHPQLRSLRLERVTSHNQSDPAGGSASGIREELRPAARKRGRPAGPTTTAGKRRDAERLPDQRKRQRGPALNNSHKGSGKK